MAQVFSGHGCFEEYLCRIGREHLPACWYCGHERDNAQHILQSCPEWGPQRDNLIRIVGEDLNLPNVIGKMMASTEAWRAVAVYCEAVLSRKEEDERERRRIPPSPLPSDHSDLDDDQPDPRPPRARLKI